MSFTRSAKTDRWASSSTISSRRISHFLIWASHRMDSPRKIEELNKRTINLNIALKMWQMIKYPRNGQILHGLMSQESTLRPICRTDSGMIKRMKWLQEMTALPSQLLRRGPNEWNKADTLTKEGFRRKNRELNQTNKSNHINKAGRQAMNLMGYKRLGNALSLSHFRLTSTMSNNSVNLLSQTHQHFQKLHQ